MTWHASERLTVVIPGFSDAAAAARLIEETFSAVSPELLAEVILVDDGGGEASASEIASLMARYPRLRLLRQLKRCGTSAALRTGARFASSDLVAMLDANTNADPRDLIRLATALIESGPETALASGVALALPPRTNKLVLARLRNWLRDALVGAEALDDNCGLAVFTRRTFLDLPHFSGMHRYLPSLMQSYGLASIRLTVTERTPRPRRDTAGDWPRIIDSYEILGVRWLKSRTRIAPVTEQRRTTLEASIARVPRPAVLGSPPPLATPVAAIEHHA